MTKLLNLSQLFWNMTRRSLQLIALWACLVIPLLEYQLNHNLADLVPTLLLWLLGIYPILYFVLGMIRQYYDDKISELL